MNTEVKMGEHICSVELLEQGTVANTEFINEKLVSKNKNSFLELSELVPRDATETRNITGSHRSLSPSNTPTLLRANRHGRNSLPTSSPEALLADTSRRHCTSSTDVRTPNIKVRPRKKKRRKSSAQQELLLNVTGLHQLSEGHSQDTMSVTSSMQSITTCPPGDLITSGSNSSSAVRNPSLYVTYSPSLSEWSSKEGNNTNKSESSSVYHSTCLYPPANGRESSRPCTPRGGRRRSSPAICTVRRQLSPELASVHPSDKLSYLQSRRHSTQAISTISLQPTASPSSLRPHSQQDNFSVGSAPQGPSTPRLYRGCSIPDNVPYLPSGKSVPCRKVRGSIGENDSTALDDFKSKYLCHQQSKEHKEIADQNCRSQFGMMFTAICFISFLCYLGVVYSQFISKSLSFSFTSYSTLQIELHPIQEVVVHISAEDFTDMASQILGGQKAVSILTE